MIERLLLAVRVLLLGPPPRTPAQLVDGAEVRGSLPVDNPLRGEGAGNHARETALSLLDDDVYGYLLIRVCKEPGRPGGEIRLSCDLRDEMWPAVTATMAHLVLGANADA